MRTMIAVITMAATATMYDYPQHGDISTECYTNALIIMAIAVSMTSAASCHFISQSVTRSCCRRLD